MARVHGGWGPVGYPESVRERGPSCPDIARGASVLPPRLSTGAAGGARPPWVVGVWECRQHPRAGLGLPVG